MSGPFHDGADEDAIAEHLRAHARAEELQELFGKETFLLWFDEMYREAGGDPARVPWADLKRHPRLLAWLAANGPHRGRALEAGCGLGDNAKALEEAGFDVTAFDISARAVRWAWRRFPDGMIDFRAADLFDAPPHWRGAFDFVHETYTLQSLPPALREKAFSPLASFVRPGGRMLVICAIRPDEAPASGPPWPLAWKELEGFSRAGLRLVEREFFVMEGFRPVKHVLSVWEKPDE